MTHFRIASNNSRELGTIASGRLEAAKHRYRTANIRRARFNQAGSAGSSDCSGRRLGTSLV